MGRKLNDGFIPARKNKVIVCEELNFYWDEPELEKLQRFWSRGLSTEKIAEHFKRDPDEVLIALIYLAREDLIKTRKGGGLGWIN
jgi:hypothetical protein